jgi:tRNA wybutosine-synthesizing protein 3
MTSRFEARKQNILEQLEAPDGEYHDLSPKGSIDAPIHDLIREINSFEGIVTTSSCSGRISVFLEGRKADNDPQKVAGEGEESRAGPGGKGGGVWLFISHDPVEVQGTTASTDFTSKFGMTTAMPNAEQGPDVHSRFIHLKFEPMVSLQTSTSPNL